MNMSLAMHHMFLSVSTNPYIYEIRITLDFDNFPRIEQPEINVSISKFEMLIFENESGIFCLSRSFTISLPA